MCNRQSHFRGFTNLLMKSLVLQFGLSSHFPSPLSAGQHTGRRRKSKVSCHAELDPSEVLLASSKPSQPGFDWPLRASLTAGTLLLLSDTLAQGIESWQRRSKANLESIQHPSSPESDQAPSTSAAEARPVPGQCTHSDNSSRVLVSLNQSGNPNSFASQLDDSDTLTAMQESSTDKLNLLRFRAHDFLRTARMSAYGFLFYGPILDVWFKGLDRVFPVKTVGTTVLKVGLSQTTLNPALLAFVFAYNYAWMGKLSELPEKYKRDLFPTMANGWRFWIPASLANFAVVPLEFRVFFSSSCSLVWNCYVSMASVR